MLRAALTTAAAVPRPPPCPPAPGQQDGGGDTRKQSPATPFPLTGRGRAVDEVAAVLPALERAGLPRVQAPHALGSVRLQHALVGHPVAQLRPQRAPAAGAGDSGSAAGLRRRASGRRRWKGGAGGVAGRCGRGQVLRARRRARRNAAVGWVARKGERGRGGALRLVRLVRLGGLSAALGWGRGLRRGRRRRERRRRVLGGAALLRERL